MSLPLNLVPPIFAMAPMVTQSRTLICILSLQFAKDQHNHKMLAVSRREHITFLLHVKNALCLYLRHTAALAICLRRPTFPSPGQGTRVYALLHRDADGRSLCAMWGLQTSTELQFAWRELFQPSIWSLSYELDLQQALAKLKGHLCFWALQKPFMAWEDYRKAALGKGAGSWVAVTLLQSPFPFGKAGVSRCVLTIIRWLCSLRQTIRQCCGMLHVGHRIGKRAIVKSNSLQHLYSWSFEP